MNRKYVRRSSLKPEVEKAIALTYDRPSSQELSKPLPQLPNKFTIRPILVEPQQYELPKSNKRTQSQSALVTIYDPDADQLNQLAKKAYLEANNHYIATPGHQFSFIKIHSGYRTVNSQAKLYDKFLASKYGGGKANPANKPGKSLHNYKLAIDIVRGTDEERLRKSLEANNWENTVDDEGWHFEPTGLSNYRRILNRIKSEVAPISDEYGKTRSDYFAFGKAIRLDKPKYDTEFNRLKQLRTELVTERKSIIQKRTANKKLRSRMIKIQRELKKDQTKLKTIRAKANQSYLEAPRGYRCPNGNDLPDCTHTQEKRNYHTRKSKLTRQANNLAASIVKRRQIYQQDITKYKRANIEIKRLTKLYQNRKKKYNRNLKSNKKLGIKLRRNVRLQKLTDAKKDRFLQRIEVAINKILKDETTNDWKQYEKAYLK